MIVIGIVVQALNEQEQIIDALKKALPDGALTFFTYDYERELLADLRCGARVDLALLCDTDTWHGPPCTLAIKKEWPDIKVVGISAVETQHNKFLQAGAAAFIWKKSTENLTGAQLRSILSSLGLEPK